MDVIERIGRCGLVPVVVIENADDAVPAAKALLDGGVDTMEITLRTDDGIKAIKKVREAYPQMLVGAGTVLTVKKLDEAIDAGAQFIVSPGFNPEIVQRCIDKGITVTPGGVTPTEIDRALAYGITTLKFFPADVYGGIKGCASLFAPFKSMGVRFIPTGGINSDNLSDYADKPYIHAVGGSWFCKASDITDHKFESITKITAKAVDALLGFEFAHVGINTRNPDEAAVVANDFSNAFNFELKPGNSSNFAGTGIEVNKSEGLGSNGHIAIKTNNIERAVYHLSKKGYEADETTAKYKGTKYIAVYLKDEIGGFAIHLLQK